MDDEKLYGYLVVTNVCRKQIYEYKRLFAKSINCLLYTSPSPRD